MKCQTSVTDVEAQQRAIAERTDTAEQLKNAERTKAMLEQGCLRCRKKNVMLDGGRVWCTDCGDWATDEMQIRRDDEARRSAEAARQAAEAARQAAEATQRADALRRAEEARRAEETRRAEELRRAEEARITEAAINANFSPGTPWKSVAGIFQLNAPTRRKKVEILEEIQKQIDLVVAAGGKTATVSCPNCRRYFAVTAIFGHFKSHLP